MRITLETKSGQKYLLTGAELVQQFEEYLTDLLETGHLFEETSGLSDFLETYEREPQDWEKLGYVCEQHPDRLFEHRLPYGEVCIGPGMLKKDT